MDENLGSSSDAPLQATPAGEPGAPKKSDRMKIAPKGSLLIQYVFSILFSVSFSFSFLLLIITSNNGRSKQPLEETGDLLSFEEPPDPVAKEVQEKVDKLRQLAEGMRMGLNSISTYPQTSSSTAFNVAD